MGIATALATLAIAPGILGHGDLAAVATARATWGTPACGTPRIESSTPARYQTAHGTGYFENNGQPNAWADDARCVIVINPRWKIRTAAKRCHIIVHEWGHLAGREHSDNYRSVMYPDVSVVSEARERGQKRWTATGAFKPCRGA